MAIEKNLKLIFKFFVVSAALLLSVSIIPVNAQTAVEAEKATKEDTAEVVGQSDEATVIWGGVSLASYADTPEAQLQAMPVIGGLLICKDTEAGCGDADVNAVARKVFGDAKFSDFSVSVGNISANQIQGYIITPVITSEAVIEAFEGKSIGYGYTHRIFGNLMIMQFLPGEVQYVAAYPFIMKRFDVQPRKLSKAEQNQVFRELYLTEKHGANFFQEMYKAAKDRLRLRDKEHNYVQINSVKLSPEVQAVLNKTHDTGSWKQQIASFFEANLARSTNVPILPSAVGSQTTKQMQVVFRDASKKLNIPPAGYSIGVDVARFIRHEAKGGKVVCFIVGAKITVEDPYGDQIADLKFARRQDSCGVTLPGSVRPDAMYFPESLYSLLYRVSQQFDGKVDDKFIKSNVEKPAGVKGQIQKLSRTMFNQ